MTSYDLTPLFRTGVGFDRMARLMDAALSMDRPQRTWPPYNIVRSGEDTYRISLAVAGFDEGDLSIQTHQGRLVVTGRTQDTADEVEFLHRGIAGRSFERTFQLADHIRVDGARLENGLLHIDLVRELPEALKPRTIAIDHTPRLEAQAAK